MLGQMKDIMKLQQQAQAIQKKLENLHIEAEVDGVTFTIDASMNPQKIQISEAAKALPTAQLEHIALEALTKALKKAQQVAAENMKDFMGGQGFPGLTA